MSAKCNFLHGTLSAFEPGRVFGSTSRQMRWPVCHGAMAIVEFIFKHMYVHKCDPAYRKTTHVISATSFSHFLQHRPFNFLTSFFQFWPCLSQGCQMVYFHTKNIIFTYLEGLGVENFGIFFMYWVIWYVLCQFGILILWGFGYISPPPCGMLYIQRKKTGNPGLSSRKWQRQKRSQKAIICMLHRFNCISPFSPCRVQVNVDSQISDSQNVDKITEKAPRSV
jgi:hypothetical protein